MDIETIKKRVTLRELMEQGPVVAPTVYDCLSARMVEESGFQAMCLSGAEMAAAYLGYPDIGLVTASELEDNVRRITASSPLPMIVDIDTGFGNEVNTFLTCRRIARAGAMAAALWTVWNLSFSSAESPGSSCSPTGIRLHTIFTGNTAFASCTTTRRWSGKPVRRSLKGTHHDLFQRLFHHRDSLCREIDHDPHAR